MGKITVKARSRQGTKSMDLTIPAKIREDLNISAGNIFEIKNKKGDADVLIYKRVYKIK